VVYLNRMYLTTHGFTPLKEVVIVINGLAKVGYLLIGTGVGIFASSFILTYEFDKAVGEIEEFIPEGDTDISNDQENGSESGEIHSQDSQESSTDIWNGREGRKHRDGREFRNGRTSDGDSGEETHQEFQSNQAQILDYYKSSEGHIQNEGRRKQAANSSKRSKRRKDFDKMREEGNANLGTRYSKMFGSNNLDSEQEVTDILHAVSSKTDTKDSYSRYERKARQMDEWEDDSPSDDSVDEYPPGEIDIHDEYTLERVEDNIEIYLDDSPNDFTTLVWYQGDETLCDDGEQIIPNPEDVVGEVAIERLLEGGPGADDGIIFVHNLKTSIDYELVLDMGCYSETVLGIFDERQSRRSNGGGRDGSS